MGAIRLLSALGRGGSDGFDPDALAFIEVAGITDNSQKSAINIFVKDSKNANLWDKYNAIYPFVGGTSSSHKWNLKDPRDLDEAYRLTFNGTPTHNQYGIDWEAISTQNANTYFNPSLLSNIYDIGLTAYVGKNNVRNTVMGAFNTQALYLRGQNGRNVTGIMYGQLINAVASAPTPHLEFYNSGGTHSLNRTANNYISIFRNKTKQNSLTYTEVSAAPNANIFLNNVTATQSGWAGQSRMQFAAIHKGLSDSEVVIFTELIENLQANLNRTYNYNSPTYRYLGDSITWQQNATDHGYSWTGLLSLNKNAKELNYGVPSYATTNIINTSLPLVANKNANDSYMFLSIGINDVPTVSVATFKANLITIINSLISKGWDNSNIILSTIYWTPTKNTQVVDYNTEIANLWNDFNLTIRPDVYQAILNDGRGAALFHADGIHPNDTGHSVIYGYYNSILT